MLLRTVGKCVSKKKREMNKNTKEVCLLMNTQGASLAFKRRTSPTPSFHTLQTNLTRPKKEDLCFKY